MSKSTAIPSLFYAFPRHFRPGFSCAALLIFAFLILFSANTCQAYGNGSGAFIHTAGSFAARHGLGTVAAWGLDNAGQSDVPSGLSKVVAVAAALDHNVALKSDGTVVAWGFDGDGETNVPAGLSGVVAVACGDDHSLALKSDGTVVGWGSDSEGQLDPPSGLKGVVAIAAGDYHSLALKSDGTVVGGAIIARVKLPFRRV